MNETAESAVQATVRLTVDGPGGRLDLAVPLWSEIASLAAGYAERTGSGPVDLQTTTGRALSPHATVHTMRLGHGDLVLAVVQGSGSHDTEDPQRSPAAQVGTDQAGADQAGTDGSGGRRPLPLRRALPSAVLLAATVVAVSGSIASRDVALASTVGLVLLALLITVLASGRHAGDAAWLAVVPPMAASAAVLVVPSIGGAVLLSTAVAGLALAASAAMVRSAAPTVRDDALVVQVVAGLVLAVLAGASLAFGWSSIALAALVLAVAVMVSQLLPLYVVDVPDHVLLDAKRLAVTAWSAREAERKSFRGAIRRPDVEEVAGRAGRLVESATFVTTLLVTATAVWLQLVVRTTGAQRVGVVLLCGAAGLALALSGRHLRDPLTRRWQRSAGAALLVLAGAETLLALSHDWRTAVSIVAIVVGLLVAIVARAVGRGWTSIGWSRAAEIVELLAFVTVLGALPLATGLFDAIRVLTSGSPG